MGQFTGSGEVAYDESTVALAFALDVITRVLDTVLNPSRIDDND